MSMEKPAYLLAGGRPSDPAAVHRSLARVLQACAKPKPKVAYLGVANQDNPAGYDAMRQLLLEAGAGEVTLLPLAREDADVGAAKGFLASADAVFLSGGEVEDGMRWLVRHGLDAFLRDLYNQGTQFFGVSAGSILMGTHWVHWDIPEDNDTASLFSCLGLIPTIFDTHAEDEDWIELKTALRLRGPGTPGYGIPRGGMIRADSRGQLVNVEKELLCFINNDGQVQQIQYSDTANPQVLTVPKH
jgi:peptidase E